MLMIVLMISCNCFFKLGLLCESGGSMFFNYSHLGQCFATIYL
ncbi:hypothetical protein KC19_5G103900 [Ceratodon purpureus]|uniref:Uncharacterized protein n=1 Tax=Ceratodon purpureus TaxID=3225 RepID=A0A8T0I1D8_CERPU|nr:hypothetical protein KC19_5G103900 [Ceratodon purpureus]